MEYDDDKDVPPPPYCEVAAVPPADVGYPTAQQIGTTPEGYALVPTCPPPAYAPQQTPYPIMMGHQLPTTLLYGPPGAAAGDLRQPLMMIPPEQQLAYIAGQRTHQAGQPPPTVVMVGIPAPGKSYAGHIALSCLVLWFCGCACGFIAFLLAVVAQCMATKSPGAARKYGKASIGLSVTGIILAVTVTFMVFL